MQRNSRSRSGSSASRRAVRPEAGPAISLAKLFPEARFFAADDILVTACRDEAHRCRPGDVFVARISPHGDGHEDVALAVARGVRGVIAERMVPTAGTPLCLVSDTAWAHARLEHAIAGDPGKRLRVIVVTGTSGKTTTAWLTAAVLAEAGLRVGVLSDLGCLGPDDDTPLPADLSSPASLAGWLARLADGGCSHAVVELSSAALAAHALAGVPCDTVVITNLATAHLDEHGTRRAYHAIKSRAVAALTADGCLVSGVAPEQLELLLRRLPAGATLLTAGLTEECDVRATPVEGGLFGRTVLAACGGQLVPISLDTPVVPFVRDCLLAAAVATRYRIPLEVAARGLESVGSVPGRVERLDRGQDTAVFLDTPTSSHALAATLASLRRLTAGRLAILADEGLVARLGGDDFGSLVSRHCDAYVLAPAAVLADDAGEHELAAYARIDRLLESLGRDDCVLVLGNLAAGHELQGGPAAGRFPLALLVDGWLQIAHGERENLSRRAA